ncbi:MAG: Rid family hydrolase, partial [Bdellovibrionota bacterium]
MKTHLILYVSDQARSTQFYSAVLGFAPCLNVSGMTEFKLNDGCKLGLMPESGIKKLLGEKLPNPTLGWGIPRAEIYIHVDDPALFQKRAIENGANELSPVDKRNWGDLAGYSLDPDGHMIVFAKAIHSTGPKLKSFTQRTFSNAPWEQKVGYCRAIRMGNSIAVTGTTSVTDDGKIFAAENPYGQAKRCLEIIEKAITPLGGARKDIIRTRIFVTDISKWQEFGRAHGEFFADHPPATT